ncbi:hypothetical protein IHE44_0011013, partial [Lamprotornis superbus]
VRVPRVGLQGGVEPRLAADPAVALHPGAAAAGAVPRGHRLAGRLRRVRHQGPRRGGPAVGGAQVQAPHELRQAQPRPQVLLQQADPAQDQGEALHLQVQLQQGGAGELPAAGIGGGGSAPADPRALPRRHPRPRVRPHHPRGTAASKRGEGASMGAAPEVLGGGGGA